MDLKPMRPTKDAPREDDGSAVWGHYNWTGWRELTTYLHKWGVDMSRFSGMNDGDLIPSATCKSVADAIEKHLFEVPYDDRKWLADQVILWRTCGGYRQF